MLVQEWFARNGGSEQVADQLAAILPDADVACLWNDTPARYGDRPIQESWLARTPLRRHKAAALPLMPMAWDRLVGQDTEFVLASSHLFAHHAGHNRDIPRLAYVHSPARYIWSPDIDARGGNPLVKAAAGPWKQLDRRRAQQLTGIAANSSVVQERIQKYWGREATVVYPPVDTSYFASSELDDALTDSERATVASLPSHFLLGASRFIPYKQLDLLVRAAAIRQEPVVLAGSGPQRQELERLARDLGVSMTVFDSPRRPVMRWLMARASVLVFPGLEDFGIIPVEAMAAGTPVVARRAGGAMETVVDGSTGMLVDGDDPQPWSEAIGKAADLAAQDCRERAEVFSLAAFERNVRAWLQPYLPI
jgi:glycosyltransferase involved in cell wall biosynthesis